MSYSGTAWLFSGAPPRYGPDRDEVMRERLSAIRQLLPLRLVPGSVIAHMICLSSCPNTVHLDQLCLPKPACLLRRLVRSQTQCCI